MWKKLLTTALILGTSAIASANTRVEAGHGRVERNQPVRVEARREPVRVERREPVRYDRDHDRDDRRVIVRDRYLAPTYIAPTYVAPAYYTPFVSSPFINGQLSLSLSGAPGRGVELASTGGATYVQEVLLQYSDGRTQMVQINRSIDGDDQPISISTDGCPVSAVTIYGSGSALNAYTI